MIAIVGLKSGSDCEKVFLGNKHEAIRFTGISPISRPSSPDKPLSQFQPNRGCNSAAALIFRAGKERIPANRRLERASPQTIVSKNDEIVSKVVEKGVIGG